MTKEKKPIEITEQNPTPIEKKEPIEITEQNPTPIEKKVVIKKETPKSLTKIQKKNMSWEAIQDHENLL